VSIYFKVLNYSGRLLPENHDRSCFTRKNMKKDCSG
jgi:hypothetical protein